MCGGDWKGSALGEYRRLGVFEEDAVAGHGRQGGDEVLGGGLDLRSTSCREANCCLGYSDAGPMTHGKVLSEELFSVQLYSGEVETKIDEPIPARNNYRTF